MGKKEYKALFWCEIPAPVKDMPPIAVYLASDEHEPELGGRHPHLRDSEIRGVFFPKRGAFFLWAGSPKREYTTTIFHELNHIALRHKLRKRTRLDDKQEEDAVEAIADFMPELLRQMNWEMPPLPNGWWALAQHARIQRYGIQRDDDD